MTKQSWEAVKVSKGAWRAVYSIEADSGQVAEVYDLEGDGGESAARLIAAAPEMRDELKSILEVLEARGIGLRQENHPQVIAKATQ